MKINRLAFSLILLFGCLFLTACQSGASSETATLVPPTVAVERPTATAELPTATPELQPRILFFGDSFTVGLTEEIQMLASLSEPPLIVEVREITHGGMSLWGHWLSPRTVTTIQEGNWTAVVLQEDLAMEGIDVEKFYEYTRKFDEEIQNIGAETILYMTWEHDNMTIEQIAAAYRDMGNELGVKVAPVGLAWSRSMAERPDLDLYGGDRSHASIIGDYMAIIVLYATIFDKSPEGLPFLPEDVADDEALLEELWPTFEADVPFLQRVAWETIVDYRAENEQ